MQIEELIDKLEKYINFNLNNPNYGGCAFIMARVAKELEKRGIYYEISISGLILELMIIEFSFGKILLEFLNFYRNIL